MKSKKGSLYMGAVFAFFFFIFGMLMVSLMVNGVTDARTDIGCSDVASLSSGEKLVCLGLDIGVPFFIVSILTFVGAFIGGKL